MPSETEARVGTPTDVGSRLRGAREAKQLSVREIADTTKISVGVLEALEDNDLARLPGGIYSRGFVRSYAAAVGLDPEKTTLEFVAQLPVEEIAEGTKSDDRPHEYHYLRVSGAWLGRCLGCWLFVARGPRSCSSSGYEVYRRAPGHPWNPLRRSSRLRRRRPTWIHRFVPPRRPRSNQSRRHR